ncbi:MAG: 23S rRNA (pseudouridine(1915)-N(3))-methyltransferase RlmH [Bacteroidales bacterium]|jgi:23S rRNA (pseudouridine1915-N3)-methyltransferase|nr:23S rRNA (pseudouridine(1915)-N(3))-methyltransferase RlmH [Bacteroidales bacterium]
MTIKLIVISKTDEKYLQQGIDIYVSRLKHYVNFELVVIPALKDQKGASSDDIKEREAALLLKQIEKCDRVILLDEHGTEHTSVGFSQYLQKQMNAGVRNLAFVIGGAFGFAPSVYAAANDKLSLSKMTFNHQMVRLFFLEQLYRAFTILHHEPYHNE